MVVSDSTEYYIEYFEVLNALTLCTTKLVKRRTMKLAITHHTVQSSLELSILCIYFCVVVVMIACCNCIRVGTPPRILSADRYRKPDNRILVPGTHRGMQLEQKRS